MSEHTELPWVAGPEYPGEPAAFVHKDGKPIADCYMEGASDGSEANAAFIVRACNSHDTLVKALESIANMPIQPGWTADTSMRAVARAALLAAREVKP